MNFKIVGVFFLVMIAVVLGWKFSQPQESPPAAPVTEAAPKPPVTTDSFV